MPTYLCWTTQIQLKTEVLKDSYVKSRTGGRLHRRAGPGTGWWVVGGGLQRVGGRTGEGEHLHWLQRPHTGGQAGGEDEGRWVVPARGGPGGWFIQGHVPGTVSGALPAGKDSRGVVETK